VVAAQPTIVTKAPEKQVETPVKAEKFVNKVLLFYSDHTYDEFFKADSQES
jgi:hypothetical protein